MTSRASNSSQSSQSSVQGSYRLADSDSDEEIETIEHSAALQTKELNEIKSLSKGLMNEEWKRDRHQQLLKTMLELDDPAISSKMVDFLLHEGVSDLLLNFITQIGSRRRPHPHENNSVELKFSYRVVMVLCVEQQSEHLLGFLSRRVESITRAMFDVFRDDSAGSFYHAARVIETLLRVLPSEVYNALVSDGLLKERMGRLLRYIGYPPVGDLLVILIGLTPLPRSSPLFVAASPARWKFFQALSEWVFLLRLSEAVVSPSEFCITSEYISGEQHCSAAAQTLSEIVEKLSNDDMGELLLQPLGHSPAIIDSFFLKGTSNDRASVSVTCQRSCLRFLCFLLKKSANPNNVIYVSGGPSSPPVPSSIPNRLYQLRGMIIDLFSSNLPVLQSALIETATTASDDPVVNHPGHVCSTPFSSHRTQLVEMLVLIVEASPSIAQDILIDLWRLLIGWNFEFAHNNIYHASFYRLIFVVLRQNDEVTLKNIFKVCKLTTCLLDAFDLGDAPVAVPSEQLLSQLSAPDPGAASRCTLTPVEKKSLRGFVINISNAIRLQVSSLPPSSFLRQFLRSHQRWNEFLPILRAVTLSQQSLGMGFTIPTADMGSSISHLTSLLAGASLSPDDKRGIDHGSDYAKSLGFDMEMDWPEDEMETSSKKKKKNKKKKKTHKKKNLTDGEEADVEIEADGDEADCGDESIGGRDSNSSGHSRDREDSDEPASQSVQEGR